MVDWRWIQYQKPRFRSWYVVKVSKQVGDHRRSLSNNQLLLKRVLQVIIVVFVPIATFEFIAPITVVKVVYCCG
jgi:hypothetical protein